MNIDKAVKKQKKSYRIFMLSMGLIFFMLPTALVISGKFYIFYIFYLVIIEALVMIAVAARTNSESLSFYYDGYRLKIIIGIRRSRLNVVCSKIVLVHVENYISQNNGNNDFKIILISSSNFRSGRMLPIKLEFLKKHTYASHEYYKLKKLHPEENFYYTIIKRGGLKKYSLLDTIYKSCVYANFTDDSIDKIKYYRENSEKYNFKYIQE